MGVGNTVVLPVIFVAKGTTVRRNTSIKIRSLKEELVVVRLHRTTTLKPLPIHYSNYNNISRQDKIICQQPLETLTKMNILTMKLYIFYHREVVI